MLAAVHHAQLGGEDGRAVQVDDCPRRQPGLVGVFVDVVLGATWVDHKIPRLPTHHDVLFFQQRTGLQDQLRMHVLGEGQQVTHRAGTFP